MSQHCIVTYPRRSNISSYYIEGGEFSRPIRGRASEAETSVELASKLASGIVVAVVVVVVCLLTRD